jgi:hypothetical protein
MACTVVCSKPHIDPMFMDGAINNRPIIDHLKCPSMRDAINK